MKKFVLHITGFLLITLILMYILDFAYTKVYQTANPRTKIQYLRKQKDKKIYYIFIGSSRVESGIVPSIIEERTHKKVLNFGFQAARLNDIYTTLRLIKNYNISYEKIFIQVDYIYNMNTNSQVFQWQILPFIQENKIYNQHMTYKNSNYLEYDYIPFYRYARNDLKLGFREVLLNLIHKKTNAMDNDGYSPLEGISEKHHFPLPNFIITKNITLDKIRMFCKKNKMKVVFYCAPFCKHTSNFDFIDKLKIKVPELHDFSRIVKDESMFQNANHLNDKGARYFTNFFVDEVIIPTN